MDKEEQLLINRLKELANTAYQREIPMFSDFLNINEQSIFKREISKMPPVSVEALGGYHLAERRIIAFTPLDRSKQYPPPIVAVLIKPLNAKFSDTLTHRDFLGAVLNLGIDRSKIGDIVIHETGSYVFCIEKIASYIIDNLTRIKHTTVMCEFSDFNEEVCLNFTEISGSVSSVRLDSILALCFASSRSSIISKIEEGKVYVNAKVMTTNSYQLKEDDIISVRGLGKFKFTGTSGVTKKGRYIATVQKYI
jgi:RNA-binding protein YlmH